MYINRGIIIYYYISIEIAIIPLENEPYLIYFEIWIMHCYITQLSEMPFGFGYSVDIMW
jgi:hypothetical protein